MGQTLMIDSKGRSVQLEWNLDSMFTGAVLTYRVSLAGPHGI